MTILNSHKIILSIKFFLPFYLLRYILHILYFIKCSKKDINLIIDLHNELKQYEINLSKKKEQNKFIISVSSIIELIWALNYDMFFLTLFYYRIGRGRTEKIHWLKKDRLNFMLYSGFIGKNFIMYHPFSTIINAKSIGDNFVIRNNTTIGNKNDNNSKIPTIGNNVSVGANVVIIGDIRIGNNVIIGAGTIINKDIPDNSVVVGNPFRIL